MHPTKLPSVDRMLDFSFSARAWMAWVETVVPRTLIMSSAETIVQVSLECGEPEMKRRSENDERADNSAEITAEADSLASQPRR